MLVPWKLTGRKEKSIYSCQLKISRPWGFTVPMWTDSLLPTPLPFLSLISCEFKKISYSLPSYLAMTLAFCTREPWPIQLFFGCKKQKFKLSCVTRWYSWVSVWTANLWNRVFSKTCKTECSGLNRVGSRWERYWCAFNLSVYFVDICPNKSPLLSVLLMFLS